MLSSAEVGKRRDGKGKGWVAMRGWFASRRGWDQRWWHAPYAILFPGPICLYGAMQIYASNWASSGPSCSIVVARAYSGARGQKSLYLRKTSCLANSPVGCSTTHGGAAASARGNLRWVGLLTLHYIEMQATYRSWDNAELPLLIFYTSEAWGKTAGEQASNNIASSHVLLNTFRPKKT